MTQPTIPDLPGADELGPCAGDPDSDLNHQWRGKLSQVTDAQAMNSAKVHSLAARGIAGADGVVLMTRLNCLIDHLFGTTDGHPGMIEMGDKLHRLHFELEIQQRTAHVLAEAEKFADRAMRASGQPHQTGSGIILPGANGRVN